MYGFENIKNGLLAELAFQSAFVEKGIPVFVPLESYSKADMIAFFNGGLQRIQVKASKTERTHGSLCVEFTHRHRNGKKEAYKSTEVDYYGVMNLINGELYLISHESLRGRQSVSINYSDIKGNHVSEFKSADILFDKVVCHDGTSITIGE